jgi:hypothetical protein
MIGWGRTSLFPERRSRERKTKVAEHCWLDSSAIFGIFFAASALKALDRPRQISEEPSRA